jgi:hypothetical protein
MKTSLLLIMVCSTAGCATLGTGPQTPANSVSAAVETTTSAPTTIDSPFQTQDTSPRFILPATGGAPVIGIPLGGDFYLPVTGGVPVIGIPTSP